MWRWVIVRMTRDLQSADGRRRFAAGRPERAQVRKANFPPAGVKTFSTLRNLSVWGAAKARLIVRTYGFPHAISGLAFYPGSGKGAPLAAIVRRGESVTLELAAAGTDFDTQSCSAKFTCTAFTLVGCQIHLKPLAGLARLRGPPGTAVLVRSVPGGRFVIEVEAVQSFPND